MFTGDELEKVRRQREEWENLALGPVMERWPERKERFETMSGMPLERVYTPEDIADKSYEEDISFPGWYPFTRGVHPTGYRGRLWTRRQVTGFATPEETNRRLKYLLQEGETGLNIVFDLPTHSMLDSDNPLCEGEVGRDGVPVDTLRDMEVIFEGIDISEVSTSLITAGPYIMSMYIALAEERGLRIADLRGTLQNDMMSLYYTVNADNFALKDALRFATDAIEYCRQNMPHWNPISFVGYQIREMGSTAAQEIAFTLASAVSCSKDLLERGLEVDDFAPSFSFFFNAHNDLFEEICKFRAARRLWATIMREDFGAKEPMSWLCRFHVQTAGCSLTAQQPVNNVVRTTIQALAAVLGGANSLHTNSMDEAFALPSEGAVRTALRTQQIVAYESGATNVVDPLGGSYYIERLTDQLEERARDIMREIDELGGMAEAVSRGWVQKEIAQAAAEYQEKVRSGETVVVGVNEFTGGEETPIEILRIDPAFEEYQKETLKDVRGKRDSKAVRASLDSMKKAVESGVNIMPACIEAAKSYASIEEMGNAILEVAES